MGSGIRLLAALALLAGCGMKAWPHPPAAALAAADGGSSYFPDAGCFDCPAGAR